jgi:hypothetical protein
MSVRAIVLASMAAALALAPRDARAGDDDKQRCAAAYEETQVLRKQGRLREAHARAVACGQPTCSAYVVRECTQFAREIEQSLPTVVFVVTDDKGADTTAVRVLLDGKPLAARLDGKAVELDPGEHTFRFELGDRAVEQKALIREGERNRTLRASFAPPAAAKPAVVPASAPTAARGEPPASPPRSAPPTAPRASASGPRGGIPTWAWVAGGAGVALAAVAVVFRVDQASAASAQEQQCPGPERTLCPQGYDPRDTHARETRDFGLFVGFGAAGVLALGAAVVGIATAPPRARPATTADAVLPSAWVGPGQGGAALRVRF